jgi:hypothetical protein
MQLGSAVGGTRLLVGQGGGGGVRGSTLRAAGDAVGMYSPQISASRTRKLATRPKHVTSQKTCYSPRTLNIPEE